ncbi:thioesterase family protein [Gordonia mangrovi]|uniref:thioesterase family protein n=1 Tax=Gordonia mangrovi TaxID=2665643 RepID=UPI0021ACEA76|nr:thioesterase family protein [Gordonia mangrovi]UVF80342.1 thioesterase family protein [Gordonia mangrovi]
MIAALAVHVAAETVPEADVRAVDLRFSGRPGDGELRLTSTVTSAGRSTRMVDVVVAQQGLVVASASVTMGQLCPPAAADIADISADVVPAPESCAPFSIPPEIVPMGQHLDLRPTDGPLPLTAAAEPWMRAWISTQRPMSVDAAHRSVFFPRRSLLSPTAVGGGSKTRGTNHAATELRRPSRAREPLAAAEPA